MKTALITDTHWGVRNDSQVFRSMMERFYQETFFPYLKKHRIKTIFHLGDIVDRRKYINYVTLNSFRNNFVLPCIENDIDLHVIVGNHDVPYRNSNDINAMAELFGGLHQNVNFYSECTDITFGGTKIAIVPWINSSNYDRSLEFINKTKANIVFGHLDLNGFEMHRGLWQTGGMSTKVFERFEMVLSGHFHHKSTKNNITYLGSPYEMTWNDYNDARGFHIFNNNTRDLTFVQNSSRMFYKLWYDDENQTIDDVVKRDFSGFTGTYVKVIVQNKTNPYWFDLMMDKLYQASPADVRIVEDNKNADDIEEADIINEAEDTLTILNKYIEGLNTNVDKQDLRILMSKLYNEAQHLEI